MGKRLLITEKHVTEALQAGRKTLAVTPKTLITPLARDTAREHGLTFVNPQPAPSQPAPSQPAPSQPAPSQPAPSQPAAVQPRTHTVAIGSDHGGFGVKEMLKPLIAEMGWQVLDVGTDSEKSCDYPDFAFAVARAVALGKADFGVMIDGAGLGSAMVCNKVPGIRAACAYNSFTAWNARAHNDAQVLTLGSRTLGIEVCKSILKRFLDTPFEGGRHQHRVDKISDVETRFSPGTVE